MMITLLVMLLGVTPEVPLSFNDNGWIIAETVAGPVLTAGEGWPVNVQVDDTPFLAEAVVVEQGPVDIGTDLYGWQYSTSRGTLVMQVEPFPALGPSAWLRSLTYKNTSETVQDLTHAVMRLVPEVDDASPAWQPKNFYLARGPGSTCVGIAYKGTGDFYRLSARDGFVQHEVDACWRLQPGDVAHIGSQGLWVSQVPDADGKDARWWGAFFRGQAQRWYDAINIRVPDGMPGWVRDMILYEYNAGGHIDSRFSDTGGYQRLAGQTDYLADMGVNAVWLQGIHSHKTPPNPVEGGWNLYGPWDVLAVDEILGGEAGLRELLDSLHAAEVRVLGEIVPHGGHSVQGEAMPEWWTYERDGTPRRNWGGWGMDHAAPPWQAVMAEAMRIQARDFGIVGCRIDVADGNGPNWESPLTNHASFSTLGGAVQLLTRVRDAMAEHTDYPVLIPEAFDQVEYFSVSPVGYGHDFWMFISNHIEPVLMEPAVMAALFREYLEGERGSLPQGALTLRTLNNHDTVCEAGRVNQRFGVGLARALHAVCLMIPGIPMLYQEQEIGSWFALRDLHHARQSVAAFASDEVDYHAVSFAPEVFAVLRGTSGRGRALGLVNLSGVEITGTVRLDSTLSLPGGAAMSDGAVVYDALSRKHATVVDGGFPWRIAPYDAAFIQIEGTAEQHEKHVENGVLSEEEHHADLSGGETPEIRMEAGNLYFQWGGQRVSFLAGDGDWMLGADDGEGRTYMNGVLELRATVAANGLHCVLTFSEMEVDDWPALDVVGADTWFVSGRTALLRDKALRRHYPWPEDVDYYWDKTMFWGPHPGGASYDRVSPTGRLWESAFEPLHPETPMLGWADEKGNTVLLRDISTDCANLVLSEVGKEEGPVLRLDFRGYDRELAPHINLGGPGAIYRVWHPEPDARKDYTVSFTISLNEDASTLAARLEAKSPRLPLDRQRHKQLLEGPGSHVSGNLGIVLPEPGAVFWEDLVLPEGYTRLQLTLRHSETGPDNTDLDNAYHIRINGAEAPFTWMQRNVSSHGNAYFGLAEVELAVPSENVQSVRIKTSKPWCMVKEEFMLQ